MAATCLESFSLLPIHHKEKELTLPASPIGSFSKTLNPTDKTFSPPPDNQKSVEHTSASLPDACHKNLDSSDDASSQPKSKVSAAEQAVCDMGIPVLIVQMARASQLQEHGSDFADATQLYTAADELLNNPEKQAKVAKQLFEAEQAKKEKLFEAEQVKQEESKPSVDDKEQLKEKVKRLAKENHRLKQRKMCRACKKVDLASSGVTFLPCGHFITCETCSEEIDDCPACGKSIMGTVRTFLS